VARYDRFIAEIELESGPRVRAHCVNPGRMEGQVRPGVRVWVSAAPPASKRKLRYTWELVETDEPTAQITGANTVVPNRIVGELLAARVLPGLRRFGSLRREVAYAGNSRVDFLLDGATPHYVEVKNAHLLYPDGCGYFPDSVSARATHHLEALAEVVAAGAKATVLFTIQRPDVRAIRPSDLHDPAFAAAARRVREAGVRFRAVTIRPTLTHYEVMREIPVELDPYDLREHRGWQAANKPWSGWVRDPSRVAKP
jgi:sugar fermentation stimulation protein A